MLFLISNFLVEITLNTVLWIIKNMIYGISNYLWGLVYQSREDKKFYIDENRWNKLIEHNNMQEKEIKELRNIIERWTDLKSSKIEMKEESEEEINEGLKNYLEESFIKNKK